WIHAGAGCVKRAARRPAICRNSCSDARVRFTERCGVPQNRRNGFGTLAITMTPTKTTIGGLILTACVVAFARAQETPMPDTLTLQKMAARFAPTDIGADVSKLPANDRRVLGKLIDAAKII